MRWLLLVAALLLGGAVSAAADMSGLSFANAHPALFVSKSKPSLLVRDASGSGLPVHQPLRVTEEFTYHELKSIPSRLKRADLENLHESRASTLSDPICLDGSDGVGRGGRSSCGVALAGFRAARV